MKSKKIKSILGICLFIIVIVLYVAHLGSSSDSLLDFLPDWMATPIALLVGLIFAFLLILESYTG